MYNAKLPDKNELPSTRQLLTSTLAALAVATALLVTAVLPAEYGVDPTGIGRALSLTQMGEIKAQLAAEAEAEEVKASEAPTAATEDVATTTSKPDTRLAEESISVTLAPGEAAEVKLAMDEAERFKTVAPGHFLALLGPDDRGLRCVG